jgi:formamidopyrimidine-DNA glycosylase
MPEIPEMQALAERVEAALQGAVLEQIDVLGFSALKTVVPAPESFVGSALRSVGRRGKYIIFEFGEPGRILVHLSQAGRLDLESPPKKTRGKGSAVRFRFDDDRAALVREYGHERKAAWWVLAPGDDGPLVKLGPEPDSDAFAEFVLEGTDKRRIHTWLRDQRTVAGIGRGYADDALHRAKLSPTSTLPKLDADERSRLLNAVRSTLADALEGERTRVGGLSAPKLGDRFTVHGRPGTPCPVCGDVMRRVSYEAYEITYCPTCQTGGKVLADRRMSRLVK